MGNTNNTGCLKAGIIGNYIITTAYDFSHSEAEAGIVVENGLTISITNLSRKDTIQFYHNPDSKVPGINDTASYENLSRIYVYFPVGDLAYHLTTIDLAKKIKYSVSRGWKMIPCDGDKTFKYGMYWAIIPDTTNVSQKLLPGDSIIINFEGIRTYKEASRMSCTCIDIRDVSNVDNFTEYLPVYIYRPEPIIRKFTCSQNFAGILDKVIFNWEVLGNIKQTRFYPGFGEAGNTSITAKSSAECIVTESTNYTIRVYGESNIVYGYCPVVVDEPVIIDFKTLDGRTKYKYAEEVNLYFKLLNTNHCYINGGIGRVNVETKFVEGYPVIEGTKKVVCNNRKVEFCLSCIGKSELIKKTILIEITDFLDIANIVYKRSYLPNEKTYKYILHWKIINATWLEIRTSDNMERTGSQEGNPVLSGTVEFENSSTDALKLTIEAKGSTGQYIREARDCNNL